jgi:hypothetical protein
MSLLLLKLETVKSMLHIDGDTKYIWEGTICSRGIPEELSATSSLQ